MRIGYGVESYWPFGGSSIRASLSLAYIFSSIQNVINSFI